MDLDQFLFEIRNLETIEQAFDVLQRNLASIGIDRVIYSLMTDFRSINLPAGHAILGNYPDDWMDYYREQNYEDIDPVRKALMLTNEPFTWEEIHRYREVGKTETHMMGEAQDAKLLDGIGLGIHCPYGEVIGMGFASSHGGVCVDEYSKARIRILATEFHYAFMKINAHRMRKRPCPLSPREIDVLLWLARGKTAPEISAILSVDGSIAVRTVRFYHQNIYAKLEVTSVPQAVAKALTLGILTFADLNSYI